MLQATQSSEERRLRRALAELEETLSREVQPHAEATQAAARARRRTCAGSTEGFGRTYTPHYFESESAPFHADLDAMLAYGERHIFVVHGPREHAKSTRARVGLLRMVLYGHVHYPLVVSETLSLAWSHVEFLWAELALNRRISADFDVEAEKRSETDGVLRLRITPAATGKSHTVQIEALSYGTPAKGKLFLQHRPDAALVDDFESTRSSRNARIGAEKVTWILQELYPAVSGPILWLGNIGADTSALWQMMLECAGSPEALRAFLRRGTSVGAPVPMPRDSSNGTQWNGNTGLLEAGGLDQEIISGAEDDIPPPTPAPEAEISVYVWRAERPTAVGIEYLWPARYEPQWYSAMRATMGEARYESEMNGYPVREGRFFRRAWFPTYASIPEGCRWYSWFDPAFGSSKAACFKALVVVAYCPVDQWFYVAGAWVRQQDPIADAIGAWYAFFDRFPQLRQGGYENNFGQDDRLRRDFDDAARVQGAPLPVSGQANTAGKAARIESLQPLASQMRLRWPAEPSADVRALMGQMLAYPDGYDDGPDALESCISRMRGAGAGEPPRHESLGKRRFAPRRMRRPHH